MGTTIDVLAEMRDDQDEHKLSYRHLRVHVPARTGYITSADQELTLYAHTSNFKDTTRIELRPTQTHRLRREPIMPHGEILHLGSPGMIRSLVTSDGRIYLNSALDDSYRHKHLPYVLDMAQRTLTRTNPKP